MKMIYMHNKTNRLLFCRKNYAYHEIPGFDPTESIATAGFNKEKPVSPLRLILGRKLKNHPMLYQMFLAPEPKDYEKDER